MLQVDTLVSEDAGLLVQPADLAITGDGRLAVLDYGPSEIVLVDTGSGLPRHTLGRRGRGPGELYYPLGLVASGDVVATANVGNNRIERFIRGRPVNSAVLPAHVREGRIVVNADGGFLLPTSGRDGVLIRAYFPNGEVAFAIGQPNATPEWEWRLEEFRRAARAGEVPSYFRNRVVAAMAADSAIWVAHSTEPRVERYAPGGALTATIVLPESLQRAVHDEYVRRNRAETSGRAVIPLEYFADIHTVDDAAWVLVRSTPREAARLIRISAGGEATQFIVPGRQSLWRFIVDGSERTVYLSSAKDATILRARLPRPR